MTGLLTRLAYKRSLDIDNKRNQLRLDAELAARSAPTPHRNGKPTIGQWRVWNTKDGAKWVFVTNELAY
jgi:hypothetical protein